MPKVLDFQFFPKKLDNEKTLLLTLDSEKISFWQIDDKSIVLDSQSSLAQMPAELADKPELTDKLFRNRDSYRRLSFSSDGRFMAVGGTNEILVWDLGSVRKALQFPKLELIRRLIAVFQGDWGEIATLTIGNEREVTAGTKEGKLIELKTGNLAALQLWSCEWLRQYHQSHPEASITRTNSQPSARKICASFEK